MSNAHSATPSQSTTVINQQQYKVSSNQIVGVTVPSKTVTEVVHVNPRAFSLDANSDTVGDNRNRAIWLRLSQLPRDGTSDVTNRSTTYATIEFKSLFHSL